MLGHMAVATSMYYLETRSVLCAWPTGGVSFFRLGSNDLSKSETLRVVL